jgi:hypothetical protein
MVRTCRDRTLEQRLRELERDGRSAKRFFGIRAARLIRVQDGERGGKFVVGISQMVIGDDEVEAETTCGFSLSEGAHAGVDGDHDAYALGVGRFEHARLHAVAVANAMWDVKADEITPGAAEHFDGGFEQDNGDGAVDVVVAVEKNRFSRGDGAFEALDRNRHAKHEERIV